MHIETDRALIPAHSPAVRHVTMTIAAPPRRALGQFAELADGPAIAAREVFVELMCSHGVEAMCLSGLPVDVWRGRLRVMLGDLAANQQVPLAFAVSFAAQLAEAVPFVDCRVTDRDGAFRHDPVRLEWRATDPRDNDRQPVNQGVLVTVASVLAERAIATARSARAHGDAIDARRVLRDIIAHLASLAPGNRDVHEIIDALRREELGT